MKVISTTFYFDNGITVEWKPIPRPEKEKRGTWKEVIIIKRDGSLSKTIATFHTWRNINQSNSIELYQFHQDANKSIQQSVKQSAQDNRQATDPA